MRKKSKWHLCTYKNIFHIPLHEVLGDLPTALPKYRNIMRFELFKSLP